jgi:hypothetical protein
MKNVAPTAENLCGNRGQNKALGKLIVPGKEADDIVVAGQKREVRLRARCPGLK